MNSDVLQLEDDNHWYVYIFIREDLSTPQIAVQSCHAAIEAAKSFDLQGLSHPSVILLSAKNEQRLHRASKYLVSQGIDHVHFREPDIGNQLTAIATEPIIGETRDLLKKYQLFNREGVVA